MLNRFCANDTDVIFVRLVSVQCNIWGKPGVIDWIQHNHFVLTLADQKTDSDTRHVKSIQPRLDIVTDVSSIVTPFPLKDALSDSCNGRVMPRLDMFQQLGKPFVVILHLWWPVRFVGTCIISKKHS